MPTLITRAGKGSELSHNELDANFTRPVAQKTTTYPIVVGDNRSVIEGNHATTPFTITLPTVAAAAAEDTGDFEVTVTNIGAALVTLDGNGAETIDGAANTTISQYGSVTVKLNAAGTGWSILTHRTITPSLTADALLIGTNNLYPAVLGTPTATTSGTSHAYTGLPATITQLDCMFSGVSEDGGTRILLQLGDATTGGYITTGYNMSVVRLKDGNAIAQSDPSTGIFIDDSGSSARDYNGTVTVNLLDATNFIYSFTGVFGGADALSVVGGTVTLAGLVDRVKLLTGGGTFDAGSINIRYQ